MKIHPRRAYRLTKEYLNALFKPIASLFYPRYTYMNVWSYLLAYPNKGQMLSMGVCKTVYSIPNQGSKKQRPATNKPYVDVEPGKLYSGVPLYDWCALLRNARCFPHSDLIITEEHKAIYDIKEYQPMAKYGRFHDNVLIRDYDKFCVIKKTIPIVIEKGFLLDGLFSWNWYHFMLQVMPKFQYLSRLVPKDVPLLVAPHLAADNNFRGLFDIFYQKYGQGREVIFMRHDSYMVKELYVTSSQSWMQPNMKNTVRGGMKADWCLYIEESLNFVRESLIGEADKKNSYPKKIYLSRKNASNRRRMINENAVCELLSKNGYTIVFPEDMSVQRQIALFAGAEDIVACSGAALTNLIFCTKGSKLLFINNFRQDLAIFTTIATLNGMQTLSIYGESYMKRAEDLHQSFTIDIELLTLALQYLKMI